MADLNRRQTAVNALRDVQRFVEGNDFANASIDRISVMKAALERNFNSFLEIHDRLIDHDDIPIAEFQTHEALRAEIENLINNLLTSMMERERELDHQYQQNQPPAPAPALAPAALNPAQAPEMRYLLTQKIENTWGEFDGTLSKWATFRDMFHAAVHQAGYMTGSFKLRQLKKSLKGEAAEVLEGWVETDENFEPAWQRLNAVFDQPHQAAIQLLSRLNELPVILKANRRELQRLSNVANTVKLQVNGLGYNTQHSDIMFIALIENKLDRETKRAWEHRRDDNPTLQQLLTFVEREAKALPFEPVKPIEDRKRHHENPPNHSNIKRFKNGNQPNYSDEKKSIANGPLKCPFTDCGQVHFLFRCPKYLALDRDNREKFLKKSRLCLNCLYPGHFVKFCVKDGCTRCKQKHNSTICPGNPFISKANSAKEKRAKVLKKEKQEKRDL